MAFSLRTVMFASTTLALLTSCGGQDTADALIGPEGGVVAHDEHEAVGPALQGHAVGLRRLVAQLAQRRRRGLRSALQQQGFGLGIHICYQLYSCWRLSIKRQQLYI